MKANTEKSVQVTFNLRKMDCPTLYLNGNSIPKSNNKKYLALHLNRRHTWKDHVKAKREHLNIKTQS